MAARTLDWLTAAEFAQLLDAAAHPPRARLGLARRDRLVLLTLALTGLRRSELIALNWGDAITDGTRPSMLVRRGKGGRPRRQRLAPTLAAELRDWRSERDAQDRQPVFCGLGGGRLHPTILTGIISRARVGAGLSKHVTAHTLRHTAVTWLRQATGDTRLVAEYLGHADLSTVSRYTHVASDELQAAAQTLAEHAGAPGARTATALACIRASSRRGAERRSAARATKTFGGMGALPDAMFGRPGRAIPTEIAQHPPVSDPQRGFAGESTCRKAPPERGFPLAGR